MSHFFSIIMYRWFGKRLKRFNCVIIFEGDGTTLMRLSIEMPSPFSGSFSIGRLEMLESDFGGTKKTVFKSGEMDSGLYCTKQYTVVGKSVGDLIKFDFICRNPTTFQFDCCVTCTLSKTPLFQSRLTITTGKQLTYLYRLWVVTVGPITLK